MILIVIIGTICYLIGYFVGSKDPNNEWNKGEPILQMRPKAPPKPPQKRSGGLAGIERLHPRYGKD